MSNNFKKINLKRKCFARGKTNQYARKRFKSLPKCARDNPENQVARQKEQDAFHFTDSEEELDDLALFDLNELPFFDENNTATAGLDMNQQMLSLTQDSVRPLFPTTVTPVDELDIETKLHDGLLELKHRSFRPNQRETAKRILQGKSTLFISPTGSGKSLCYQLPALLYWRHKNYMTIVVSPLISLMEDQLTNFPASLKAVTLHSGMNAIQRRRSIEQLANQEAQVVFISPEAIVGGLLDVEDLKSFPPVGFVCIDEAHCLSEWSHNFRPAYLQFFEILREKMNIKVFLALTATATQATSSTVAKLLKIDTKLDVIGSTVVPDNLILSVSHETNKEISIIELLKTPTFRIMTSIIVYCSRREETERVASRIRTSMKGYSTLIEIPQRGKSSNSKTEEVKEGSCCSTSGACCATGELAHNKPHIKLGWLAEAYHAGLSSDTRKRIQRQFIKGEIRVVCATIAFGMGINKANVRAIIHYDMPSSFESYVQEIGRAGRDGLQAHCHMFLSADKSDLYYQQRHIYSSITEKGNIEKLTDFMFKPCRCSKLAFQADRAEIEARNKDDIHEVTSAYFIPSNPKPKTSEENSPVNDDSDTLSPNSTTTKENIPELQKRSSLVRKHRLCKGHEVAFSVDEATTALNLRPESIITLINQIHRAYPQLQIRQFNPIKSKCNVFCYRGAAQMDQLRKTTPPIRAALVAYELERLRSEGKKPNTPSKLDFDVVKIASELGMPTKDVMKMLRKTEWELVEQTGRFRKSQVRVRFDGNSFHLVSVGDLDETEIKEINNFLFKFMELYEKVERDRVAYVFSTLKRHSISMDVIQDQEGRLNVSNRLKASLNAYFDPSLEHLIPLDVVVEESDQITQLSDKKDPNSGLTIAKIIESKEKLYRKSARSFISAHGKEFKPKTIARIFQGISTPNYPAEHWGMNRRWWRIHLDVDFLRLVQLIELEYVSY